MQVDFIVHVEYISHMVFGAEISRGFEKNFVYRKFHVRKLNEILYVKVLVEDSKPK